MAPFDTHQYQRVDDGSETGKESLRDPGPRLSFKTTAIILVTVLCAAVISVFSYNQTSSHQSSTQKASTPRPNIIYHPCGRNYTDAIAAGCVYDVMMNSWLPKSCYDEELSTEFWNLREWEFYADTEATHPLTVEELSHRVKAHATLQYHFAHCIYGLRKVQRAIAQGRDIEEDVASEAHDHHCSGILQRGITSNQTGVSLTEVRTTLNIAYPTCVNATDLSALERHAPGY